MTNHFTCVSPEVQYNLISRSVFGHVHEGKSILGDAKLGNARDLNRNFALRSGRYWVLSMALGFQLDH